VQNSHGVGICTDIHTHADKQQTNLASTHPAPILGKQISTNICKPSFDGYSARIIFDKRPNGLKVGFQLFDPIVDPLKPLRQILTFLQDSSQLILRSCKGLLMRTLVYDCHRRSLQHA